jgi:uncharacterized membrane protein YagU involved in acid resistance
VLAAILSGGLIASTIDIGAASLINWINPVIILHAIASGLLGKQSFQDGPWAAFLGLILQWGMGLLIAAIYVTAARRLAWMTRSWVKAGFAYGLMIYVVMNYIVVPLSAARPGWNFAIKVRLPQNAEDVVAMVVFGLIIAFAAQYFLAQASSGGGADIEQVPEGPRA